MTLELNTTYFIPQTGTSLTGSKKEKRHTRQGLPQLQIETLLESASLGIARNPSDLPLIAFLKERDRRAQRPGGGARGEVPDDARKRVREGARENGDASGKESK